MPRVNRSTEPLTMGDFKPPIDATNQDVVDAVETVETSLKTEIKESNDRLERHDRLLELILGQDMEEV